MSSAKGRAIVGLIATAVVALIWGLQEISAPAAEPTPTATRTSTASSTQPSTPRPSTTSSGGLAVDAGELEGLLEQVLVSTAPDLPGYDRDCGPGAGCVFGPAWTDDYEGPGGHDGCDTRNNVLQRDLTGVRFRPGTHDCVAISGTLEDPYTGRPIAFSKTDASKVQIDHIYPLAAAYRRGAATWPLSKRIRFANDMDLNLLAVSGSANASKGDRTPGEWMPINSAIRCDYSARFLRVTIAYSLPITSDDHAAIEFTAKTC